MDLGLLITHLESEQNAGEALAALGDLMLYAEVLATGARFDEGPGCYAAGAVGRFAGAAGDAEWVTLLGAMERAEQPGQAFLRHAIKWALARDARDRHSQAAGGTCATGARPEPCHDAST